MIWFQILNALAKTILTIPQIIKQSIIQVMTPVGLSMREERDEGLGQGPMESAVLSSTSFGEGVEKFFGDSRFEV